MDNLLQLIRDVPDFPKKGIIFKDITTLLQNASGWKTAIDGLATLFDGVPIDKVLGIEARGFAFAATLAYRLNAGLILVRKPGKLPYKTISHTYDLEYGTDTLEIHEDAVIPGEKILLVDDLLATGGTLSAAVQLVERLHGEVAGIACLIELDFLHGRDKLAGYQVKSLLHF